jgi:hypothetical protein
MQLIDSPKERAKRPRTPIDKSVAPRSKATSPECPSTCHTSSFLPNGRHLEEWCNQCGLDFIEGPIIAAGSFGSVGSGSPAAVNRRN